MEKEKKIKDAPDPVNIQKTKKILDQMINCICKIKIKGANGTGFLCQIPSINNITGNYLITNYHIIDETYYKENKEINILLNDDQEIRTIDLGIKRETYFNKDYDIAIIELNTIDKINNYLELDDNLFIEKEKIFYQDKSIYILQYPNGNKAGVSYGLLSDLEKYDIKHLCSTEHGSSGSPILNLETNKVIGIHKEGSTHFNFNKGTFLKYPLKDFLEKRNNKINKANNHENLIGTEIKIEKEISQIKPLLNEVPRIIESIEKEFELCEIYKDTLQDSKNFKKTIKQPSIKKEELPPGIFATTCMTCTFTCYEKSTHIDENSKMEAMDKNGYCKFCPKKCHWSQHKNRTYILKDIMIEREIVLEELKKRYFDNCNKLSKSEQIIGEKILELKKISEECYEIQNELRKDKGI